VPAKETTMSASPAMRDLLGVDAPSNWGEWGPDDELVNGTGVSVIPIPIR